ncbi:MAG: hypothetical protein AAF613_05025 [Pseudomonadota bacterium]
MIENTFTYKCAGFCLGMVGTVLTWQSGIAVAHFFANDGAAHLSALLFDPNYALRTIAAMSAFVGGLAALTERRGGSWLAGLSSFLFLVQTMALMAGKGSIHTWQTEATTLTILTALFLTMTVAQGSRARAKDDDLPPLAVLV